MSFAFGLPLAQSSVEEKSARTARTHGRLSPNPTKIPFPAPNHLSSSSSPVHARPCPTPTSKPSGRSISLLVDL